MMSLSRSVLFPRIALLCGVSAVVAMLSPGCAEKMDSPPEFLELAHRHERDGKLPEAVVAYLEALKLNDQQPTAWYDLGVAFAAMEKFPEAINAYTKAIELDGNMARAFNNRAAAYARLKQYPEAIADCDRAIALDRDDYLAWRNRGLAKHDHGDLDSAVSDYDESIRINGRTAETYHYRGNVFLDRKQWGRALEDFDHAVHVEGQMAAAWLSRAMALARLGRRTDAEESLQKAQKLGSTAANDVILADLFPDVPDTEVVSALQQQAVEFVKAEFLKEQRPVEVSDSPWDLRSGEGEAERRYIVRVPAGAAEDSVINFTDAELREIMKQPVDTTLLVVESVAVSQADSQGKESSADDAGSQSSFRIVRTIDHWTPDLSVMQPLKWSLPVSSDGSQPGSAAKVSSAP